jgi:hypothetical protein
MDYMPQATLLNRIRAILTIGLLQITISTQTAAQLSNTSFEDTGPPGQIFAHWSTFGIVSATSQLATDGVLAARVGVPGSGGLGLSGVYQDMDIAPGQYVKVTADAGFTSISPVRGDSRGIINVEWRDTQGALISYNSYTASMSADEPGNTYEFNKTIGPAPANTATARLLLGAFETANQHTGIVNFDRANMVPTSAPTFADIQATNTGSRIIEWSGYQWRVGRAGFADPGNNLWTDSSNAVWVDELDQLHLRIYEVDGQWYSSALSMLEPLGHGDYSFTLVGRVDLLDIHTVLGLFTWEYQFDYTGSTTTNVANEFDIEFSRWGQPANLPAQFVVQPWQLGDISRFDPSPISDEALTSYAFKWATNHMDCIAYHGENLNPTPNDIIHTWTYTGPNIPEPGQTRILINHWMINQPPSDLQPQEVIIKSFRYTPACPADTNSDGSLSGADFTAWINAFNSGSPECDQNLDGSCTPTDFTAWIDNYNDGCD